MWHSQKFLIQSFNTEGKAKILRISDQQSKWIIKAALCLKYKPTHWYLILHILKSNHFNTFIDVSEFAAFKFVDTAVGKSINLAVQHFSSLLYSTVIKIPTVFIEYECKSTGCTEYYHKSVLYLLKRTWNMRLCRCSTDLR